MVEWGDLACFSRCIPPYGRSNADHTHSQPGCANGRSGCSANDFARKVGDCLPKAGEVLPLMSGLCSRSAL